MSHDPRDAAPGPADEGDPLFDPELDVAPRKRVDLAARPDLQAAIAAVEEPFDRGPGVASEAKAYAGPTALRPARQKTIEMTKVRVAERVDPRRAVTERLNVAPKREAEAAAAAAETTPQESAGAPRREAVLGVGTTAQESAGAPGREAVLGVETATPKSEAPIAAEVAAPKSASAADHRGWRRIAAVALLGAAVVGIAIGLWSQRAPSPDGGSSPQAASPVLDVVPRDGLGALTSVRGASPPPDVPTATGAPDRPDAAPAPASPATREPAPAAPEPKPAPAPELKPAPAAPAPAVTTASSAKPVAPPPAPPSAVSSTPAAEPPAAPPSEPKPVEESREFGR